MTFLILLAIIAFSLFFVIQSIKREAPENRRRKKIQYGIYALIIIMIILVITGRMHWVAAAITALIPILQKLFILGLRFFPFLSKFYQYKEQSTQKTSTKPNQSKMDLEEALKIFGLEQSPLTEKEIIQRHRELIQKIHPDRGGSDYLAAQINTAKDVLINQLSS